MTKHQIQRLLKKAAKYPEQLTNGEKLLVLELTEMIKHLTKDKCQRPGCDKPVAEGQNYCSVKCYNGWEDRPTKKSNKDLREFTRKFK